MMAELSVSMTIDTESERQIFAYGGRVLGEMFPLIIFRCPSCGSTGRADSWCEGHSAPMETYADSLRIKREPVLVSHSDPVKATTECVEHPHE
jgi:hypothetical protein